MIVFQDPKRPITLERFPGAWGVPLKSEIVVIPADCLSRASIHPHLPHAHGRQWRLTPTLLQWWVLIHVSQPWSSSLLFRDWVGVGTSTKEAQSDWREWLLFYDGGVMVNFMCHLEIILANTGERASFSLKWTWARKHIAPVTAAAILWPWGQPQNEDKADSQKTGEPREQKREKKPWGFSLVR